MNNFIVAGIGGQGVLTCSKLILEAALSKGYNVRSAETIGMAQRGGSVVSHVRFGEKIYSPFIPKGKVDEIISLDYIEAFRYQSYIKKNGLITTIRDSIEKANSYIPQREDICIREYDFDVIKKWKINKKNINIMLLGAVFSKSQYLISVKDIEQAIKKIYIGKMQKENLEALYLGVSLAREAIGNEG